MQNLNGNVFNLPSILLQKTLYSGYFIYFFILYLFCATLHLNILETHKNWQFSYMSRNINTHVHFLIPSLIIYRCIAVNIYLITHIIYLYRFSNGSKLRIRKIIYIIS